MHNQNTRGNKMSTQKFINFNNTVACLTWVNCSLWDENALKCHQGSYQLCAFSVCSWSFHVQTGRKQKASFVTTTKYTTDQMGRWSNKLLCSKTPPASYILEPQQERLQNTEKKQIFKFLLINENVYSFDCLGFAYRQPQTAGEVLNCDLTDKVRFQQ